MQPPQFRPSSGGIYRLQLLHLLSGIGVSSTYPKPCRFFFSASLTFDKSSQDSTSIAFALSSPEDSPPSPPPHPASSGAPKIKAVQPPAIFLAMRVINLRREYVSSISHDSFNMLDILLLRAYSSSLSYSSSLFNASSRF